MEDFPAMFEDTGLIFLGPMFGVKLGIVFESFWLADPCLGLAIPYPSMPSGIFYRMWRHTRQSWIVWSEPFQWNRFVNVLPSIVNPFVTVTCDNIYIYVCDVYQLVHEIVKFEVRPWPGISITTKPGIGSPKAAGAFAPWQRWRDISVSLRRQVWAGDPNWGFPWGYPNSWMVYQIIMENPKITWMITGGTPHFLGNLQLTVWW